MTLSYFNVSFSAGKFPNSLNGQLQITPDQGVTMASSQEDVATISKKLIQAMVADQTEQESK
ncbi:hypothetical protein EFN64_08580 [Leuconostoc citreum]|nr:hypothetical protein [Leuconostoc citreum]